MTKQPKYIVPRPVERVLSDLLSADDVAELIGLADPRSLYVYTSRYGDFPQPVLTGKHGRGSFWLRSHVLEWREMHPGIRAKSE
jgi:predicted DNA-binding transcriptional regulator AlpA